MAETKTSTTISHPVMGLAINDNGGEATVIVHNDYFCRGALSKQTEAVEASFFSLFSHPLDGVRTPIVAAAALYDTAPAGARREQVRPLPVVARTPTCPQPPSGSQSRPSWVGW